MRVLIDKYYRGGLRLLGAWTLMFCAIFFASLQGALQSQMNMLFPALLMVPTAMIALLMTVQRLTPSWLLNGKTPRATGGALALLTIVPWFFAMAVMMSVISLGMSEPQAQSIAVTSAFFTLMGAGVLWCLAAVRLVWNAVSPPSEPQEASQEPEVLPLRISAIERRQFRVPHETSFV